MQQPNCHELLNDIAYVRAVLPANFAIAEKLAPGGQGVVYRGTVDGEDAAVKLYFPGQVRKRIEREVNALAEIDSPSIVRLIETAEVSAAEFPSPITVVATELVEGTPLDAHLGGGPLDEAGTVAIIRNISDAIDAMWSRRIVHRDIKPNNIILRPDGSACLIDLGVARHVDATDLTQVGHTWGTRGYMSPEQMAAIRQLTCKSDVYATGVVALVCGLAAHPSHNDQAALVAADLHLGLPGPIGSWKCEATIRAMLDPRPTRRPLPSKLLGMV